MMQQLSPYIGHDSTRATGDAGLPRPERSRGWAPARRAPSFGLPLARRLHAGAVRGRAAAASDGAAWNPASGGDRVASWSDKRKAAVGPIAGETGKADCPPQYTVQVQAGRGAGAAKPAAWRDHCGHDAGDRLAGSHRPRLPRRGGAQEALSHTAPSGPTVGTRESRHL